MCGILKPPKGKVESIAFLVENTEKMVRRQGERAGRWAYRRRQKAEAERHTKLNSDRFDTGPKAKSASEIALGSRAARATPWM